MTDDIDPQAARAVDTLISAWTIADAASQAPYPDEFLVWLEANLTPLVRGEEQITALVSRFELARRLLPKLRTDPRPRRPGSDPRRPDPAD